MRRAQTLRLVAIGGGGCTNDRQDPELDRWIISLLGLRIPRIGYLGTASQDRPDKYDGFLAAYSQQGVIAPPLSAEATAGDCAEWLEALDLVYVGGGHTQFLLSTWRQSGWDGPLCAAAHQGVMLAGVSAGAVCWFEAAFSDSAGPGFRGLPGLGLVKGSCCPHYSEEPHRQPAYEAAIRAGLVPPGLAIDDGVGVLCDQTGPMACYSARPGRGAYRITCEAGAILTRSVPDSASEA